MARLRFIALVFLAVMLAALPARAQICGADEETIRSLYQETRDIIKEQGDLGSDHIKTEFADLKDFLYEDVFLEHLLPTWQAMTEDVTTAAVYQEFIFGTFLDAKQQMETQRTFQELTARAYKDYHPSTQLCTFATATHSLTGSQTLVEASAQALNEAFIKRQTGSSKTAASPGEAEDRKGRLQQFQARFCDKFDNGGMLEDFCEADALPAYSIDKDIDFAGGVNGPLYTNDGVLGPGDDQQNLLALSSNLYGHITLPRLQESVFDSVQGQASLLDLRAIVAKRGVAAASFNEIVAQRAAGSADAYRYTLPRMFPILKGMGFSTDDIIKTYEKAPSYYGQMEILTKKIYQDPAFYTNLYDSPANVGRTKVTMQAIGLMQDFDTLKSYLRTEMMLSVMLELELIKQQTSAQNLLAKLKDEGEPAEVID